MFENIEAAEKTKIVSLLKAAGDSNPSVANAAQTEIAAALTQPIRQGVLTGDIIGGIFEPEVLEPGATPEYQIDIFRSDNEFDYTAYVMPSHGKIASRIVESDYVTVPTFRIANSIDIPLRFIRDQRWPILSRAMEVLDAGFVKKMNDDGWHTILKAAVDRNIVIYDAAATAGQFTKRLVSTIKNAMRRNGGGNSTSINRSLLTHLYVSPEATDDMRNWGMDQLDEVSRREIYVANDGTFSNVFGVKLVDLDELGEAQLYQNYYTTTLGASMAGSDVEVVVGVDLSRKDSFVMPIREQVSIFNDPSKHREGLASFYGNGEYGLATLDSRRVIVGSL